MNTTPPPLATPAIRNMTLKEYSDHLNILPFFERMATMKAYNGLMFDKVVNECSETIYKSLDDNPNIRNLFLPNNHDL